MSEKNGANEREQYRESRGARITPGQVLERAPPQNAGAVKPKDSIPWAEGKNWKAKVLTGLKSISGGFPNFSFKGFTRRTCRRKLTNTWFNTSYYIFMSFGNESERWMSLKEKHKSVKSLHFFLVLRDDSFSAKIRAAQTYSGEEERWQNETKFRGLFHDFSNNCRFFLFPRSTLLLHSLYIQGSSHREDPLEWHY